jgi:hypothetical protein
VWLRRVEFRRFLDEHNALRVRFEVDRGQVVYFIAQIEAQFSEEWTPVMRYDTAHGYAHCDVLHPRETPVKIRLPHASYNEALSWSLQDLQTNWRKYSERYYRCRKSE